MTARSQAWSGGSRVGHSGGDTERSRSGQGRGKVGHGWLVASEKGDAANQ